MLTEVLHAEGVLLFGGYAYPDADFGPLSVPKENSASVPCSAHEPLVACRGLQVRRRRRVRLKYKQELPAEIKRA